MNNSIIVTAYGNSAENRGLTIIKREGDVYNAQILPVDGKCNFCIRVEDRLYASVQADQSYLLEYQYKDGTFLQTGSYPTRYFYSHGVIYRDMLLLASFSDGADAIYDMEQHKEIDFCVHEREGYTQTGRSHFIGATPDKLHVYAVDNALQQIYLYDIEDRHFVVQDVREFSEENIRLMPYSTYSGYYYLNTEITNRVYVLKYTEEQFHIRSITDLTCGEKCFSGGNAVSLDGRRLCVTMRGDNHLHYFRIMPDGDLELLDKVACKEMPRDVLFQDDGLYVTCTNDDVIEIYNIEDDKLKKAEEIHVCQPITFACR